MKKLYYRKFCRLLMWLLVAGGMSTQAWAQIPVTGTVTSSDGGGGLPGVNVVLKGTTEGTITDVDGKYAISVPSAESTLIFSYIGHVTVEQVVGDRALIDVALAPDVTTLSEVVVVGYGTQKKINMTGAVSAIKVDETLRSRSLANVSSGLAGLLPGLAVSSNSGMAGRNNVSILIRGLGTTNNADPLVVVDGMPDVDINRINMADVESITILKDATSAAVYGSRASNGVILITTKTGKGEATKINLSSTLSIDYPVDNIELMADYPRALTIHQQASMVNTYRDQLLYKDGTIDQWLAMGLIDPLRYPNTDWWDVILREGHTNNTNLSASGSNDKSNFFISAGIMDQQGLQVNNDFKRYNARINYDYKVRDNINVGIRMGGNWSTYTRAFDDGFTGGDGATNAFDLQAAIAGITPYDPVTGFYGGVMAYNEDAQAFNPYAHYMLNATNTSRQEVNPSIYLDWTPIKGLTGRIDYTLDYYNEFVWVANPPARAFNFQTNTPGTRNYVGVNAGVSNNTRTGYKSQFTGRVNYNKVIADNHEIGAMLAYSEEYWYGRTQGSSRLDRLHPSLKEINAALAETQSASGSSVEEGLQSYIGRVNYVAFGKYLLEANFRYDGSSKFLPPNQYGFFPSVALGWIFTNENFMTTLTNKFLSSGKLRISYGGLGNNGGVGYYEQQETLSAGAYIVDRSIVRGFVNEKMINRNLTWESTYVTNFGLDLGFFQNKLLVELDYYDRLTIDMLRESEMSIHLTGAYNAPRQNIGELRNRGFEGNFTWSDRIGSVTYSVNLNGSYNHNRLEKWNEYLGRGTSSGGRLVFINMPVDYGYMYEDIGIAQTWQDIYDATPQGAAPGDILRLDINGDGRISGEDMKAYPHANRAMPSTNFGLNTNVAWKGIDLSIFFMGSTGRKDNWINIYNNVNFATTRAAHTWDHWTEPWSHENRDGSWPRLYGNNNRNVQTFWMDDLSFIRLKNVQIGYTIPATILNRVGISNVRIYSTAENLLTFTKFRGLDPEKQGIDNDPYPLIKSFSLGVNIGI